MVETKKEETKEVQDRWSVQLAIVDENKPPQKIIVDGIAEKEGEGNFDIHSAIAKLLNNQERLMKLLD